MSGEKKKFFDSPGKFRRLFIFILAWNAIFFFRHSRFKTIAEPGEIDRETPFAYSAVSLNKVSKQSVSFSFFYLRKQILWSQISTVLHIVSLRTHVAGDRSQIDTYVWNINGGYYNKSDRLRKFTKNLLFSINLTVIAGFVE